MLHEFSLDLVIRESINSNTAFRIHSILYVTVVMMLNLVFIFSSTVSYIVMNVAHSLSSLVNIDHTLSDNTDFSLAQILLFGKTTFNTKENTKIANLTIDFVLSTERFDGPLL